MLSSMPIRCATLALTVLVRLSAAEDAVGVESTLLSDVVDRLQQEIRALTDAHKDAEAAKVQKQIDEIKDMQLKWEERNALSQKALKEKREKNAALAKEIDEQQAIFEAYNERIKALTAPDPVNPIK